MLYTICDRKVLDMLLFIAIASCVGVGVFGYPAGYPPYTNDVYLQMLVDRQKDSAYPANWYDNSPNYQSYDYKDVQNPYAYGQGEASEEQWADDRRVVMDMEVDAYWPTVEVPLGQVAGVAVDASDNPVVFHRADHPWDPKYQMFDDDNKFLAKDAGPIQAATVVTLSKDDGSQLDAWGANKFYMPHGITIDNEENVWLTDVAMHQIFKFTPGSDQPALVLGQAFEPAASDQDKERFCKPTDVAVSKSGHVFVADGYCNSRVVRFSASGEYQGQFGEKAFVVPHSLALAEDLDLLCVADREHKRILCYNAGLHDPSLFGRLEREYADPIESKIYALEYNSATGLLFAVNAPTLDSEGTGYTIDLQGLSYTADIIDVWSPFNNGFTAAHDITVSHDGSTIYVGEITLDAINLWKFNDVEVREQEQSSEEESEDEEEEITDESEEIEDDSNDEIEDKSNEEIAESQEIVDESQHDGDDEDVEQKNMFEDKEKKMAHDVETNERVIDSGAPAM